MIVNGDIIVKGDQILDGGIKIVKGEKTEKKEEPLTEEELKENIGLVRNKIERGRMWFCVCKYMMWRRMVPEGNFSKAVEIIEKLYPDVSLNAKDLSSLNVMSFRKELKDWKEDDSPFKDRATFFAYRNLAELLMEM